MSTSISVRTWLALLGLILTAYAVFNFMPVIISTLVLLFMAALLSLLISPAADKLSEYGVNRGLTVALVLGIIFTIMSYLVVQIFPLLVNSMDVLVRLLPRASNMLDQLPGDLPFNPAEQVLSFATALLQQISSQITSFLGSLGGLAFALFVLIVVVFTLVSDPAVPRNLMHWVLPQRFHQRTLDITAALSTGLSRWFFAQLAISGYYFLAYAIVNTILGVPFGIPIALLAGLLEFIPYLGGIVGLVLSVLAASTVGIETVIWVVITNTIIGAVCVYFVSPFFYSKAVELPVAAVLLGLFIGSQVGGFFPALLTIPIVTIIMILLRELRATPPGTMPQTPAEPADPTVSTPPVAALQGTSATIGDATTPASEAPQG